MPSRSKPASTQYFALSKMAHIYTDFQPSIEWTQDAKNNVLRIYLPGFRKDEFRVQVDSSGKLTVKGRRPLGDGKFMHLERVFAVPKDSHTDKISGKFEGGCLSLFMPKKEVPKTAEPPRPVPRMPSPPEPALPRMPSPPRMPVPAIQKDQPVPRMPGPLEPAVARMPSPPRMPVPPIQQDQPVPRMPGPLEPAVPRMPSPPRMPVPPIQQDQPVPRMPGPLEPAVPRMPSPPRMPVPPIQQDQPVPRMPGPPEPIQEAKPAADDKKEEAPIQKDQPKSNARKEEEPIQKAKAKDGEETKAAAPVHEEKPLTDEKKEEHLIQDEPLRKKKPMSSAASDDRFEKYKKKGLAWKETIEEGVERWLDYGLMDGLLETIKKNKDVIAVAVAAFSAGFYVSGKLRSSGR